MASDRGSAPLEFIGVSGLIAIVALGILQAGIVAHVSAVVTDSAIAGAAYAALADSSVSAGVQRTRDLIEAGIAGDLVDSVAGSVDVLGGSSVATVTVRYRVPAFGLFLPTVSATTRGRVILEKR